MEVKETWTSRISREINDFKNAPLSLKIVVGIVALYIVCSAYFIGKQIPQLKDSLTSKDTEITNQKLEIQRLENLLNPFRTIALEKYVGTDAEILKKLADEMKDIQETIDTLSNQPNFDQNMWRMLTGIHAEIFKDFHQAIDYYEQQNYELANEYIRKTIDAYEKHGTWDLKNYSKEKYNEIVGEFYNLASKINIRLNHMEDAYNFSKKSVSFNNVQYNHYGLAVAAYNTKRYKEALENINFAIENRPKDYSIDLSVYQEIKDKCLVHINQIEGNL